MNKNLEPIIPNPEPYRSLNVVERFTPSERVPIVALLATGASAAAGAKFEPYVVILATLVIWAFGPKRGGPYGTHQESWDDPAQL